MKLETKNEVIQDITEFLYPMENSAAFDAIELYNMWTDKHGVILDPPSLVNIALSFINDAKTLDKSILAESYILDQENNIFSS